MVISTYSVFGHTWDEPEHLAAGMSLIDRGEYPYDQQHPPLARVAMALGPYLAGARSQGNPGPSGEEEGRDILYGEHYDKYLMLARVGMLPFLIVLLVSTYLWTRRLFDSTTALLATAFIVTTPMLIGHAGVAALDLPMVGMCMLAFYCLQRWLDAPSLPAAAMFGIAAGCAAGTKLSAVPFVGLVFLFWSIAWSVEHLAQLPSLWKSLLGQIALAALTACLALFLCYGIGFVPLSSSLPLPVPIGLPRFIESLRALLLHNNEGHLSYFMGELQRTGWWNFYLVGLAVKTPIPVLLGAIAGSAWLSREAWRTKRARLAGPVFAAVGILAFCILYSRINIGVRHVLLLLPLFAIIAAAFAMTLWRRARQSSQAALACIALAALAGWQVFEAARAQPDYLAYFNALAGTHPERILIDSDLDWGQDLKRLKQALRDRNIVHISVVYRGSADFDRERMPASFTRLWPEQRATGWIAVFLLAKATDESGGYRWLDELQPVARIGRTVDLYFVAPAPSPTP
jgi:hypothetical protein